MQPDILPVAHIQSAGRQRIKHMEFRILRSKLRNRTRRDFGKASRHIKTAVADLDIFHRIFLQSGKNHAASCISPWLSLIDSAYGGNHIRFHAADADISDGSGHFGSLIFGKITSHTFSGRKENGTGTVDHANIMNADTVHVSSIHRHDLDSTTVSIKKSTV